MDDLKLRKTIYDKTFAGINNTPENWYKWEFEIWPELSNDLITIFKAASPGLWEEYSVRITGHFLKKDNSDKKQIMFEFSGQILLEF